MKSLRSLEGYVMVDHRDSPGVPAAMAAAAGVDPEMGRGFFESATVTCRHCQRVIVLRPDRSRERHYCRGCNHYICDTCASQYALDFMCRDIERQFAAMLEEIAAREARTVHTGFTLKTAPAAETPTAVDTGTEVGDTSGSSIIALP